MDADEALDALRSDDKQALRALGDEWSEERLGLFLRAHHETTDLDTLIHPISTLSPEAQQQFIGLYDAGALAVHAAREDLTIDGSIVKKALVTGHRGDDYDPRLDSFVRMLRMLDAEQFNDVAQSFTADDAQYLGESYCIVLFVLRPDELTDESVEHLVDVFDDELAADLGPWADGAVSEAKELKEAVGTAPYIFERIRRGQLNSADIQWLDDQGSVPTAVYYFFDHLRGLNEREFNDEQFRELVRAIWDSENVAAVASFTSLHEQGYRFEDLALELGREEINQPMETFGMMQAALRHDVGLTGEDHETIVEILQDDFGEGFGLGRAYCRYILRNDCNVSDDLLKVAARYTTLGGDSFVELLQTADDWSQQTLQHCTLNLLAEAVVLGEKADANTEGVQKALVALIDRIELPRAHPDSSFYASLVRVVNNLEASSPMDGYTIIETAREALRMVLEEADRAIPDEELGAVYDALIDGDRVEIAEALLQRGQKPPAQQAGQMLDSEAFGRLIDQYLDRRERQSASAIEQVADD